MKLFAVLATFLLCTELSFGAKTSNKNSVKKSLRKMVSAEGCKTVTVTAEGDPWNAEALAAGAITTWAYPMYLKGTTTEVGEWEGYCVGLGTAVDTAGGQICTNLFVLKLMVDCLGSRGMQDLSQEPLCTLQEKLQEPLSSRGDLDPIKMHLVQSL